MKLSLTSVIFAFIGIVMSGFAAVCVSMALQPSPKLTIVASSDVIKIEGDVRIDYEFVNMSEYPFTVRPRHSKTYRYKISGDKGFSARTADVQQMYESGPVFDLAQGESYAGWFMVKEELRQIQPRLGMDNEYTLVMEIWDARDDRIRFIPKFLEKALGLSPGYIASNKVRLEFTR